MKGQGSVWEKDCGVPVTMETNTLPWQQKGEFCGSTQNFKA